MSSERPSNPGAPLESSADQLTGEPLKITEEHFRLAQAAAHIGTWEWDPVTGKSRLSPELYQMFGTGEADDPLSAWTANVHPDDMAKMPGRFAEANRTGSMDFEYRYIHPEKGLRWFYCKGARMRAENLMFGIVMDITDRKQAEISSLRLAAIVQSSDDAIVSKDLNGIVTSWNPAAERMFGYTPEEIIGKPITAIIPPELRGDEDMILGKIRRGEKIDHFDTVRITKSGERVDVSLTVSPIKDRRGIVIGASKIARDVRQRKKAEEALRISEKLASVGRLAATVAHEINNPLAAVVNLIYLIKRSPALPADVRRYVNMAEEELNRISSLTRQTLGFYREERGASPTRLGELSHTLVAVFAPKAANKRINVRLDVRSDPEIYAVQSEIRQLIANLLGNSIDAVPQNGSILLRVSSAASRNGDQSKGVRLSIADTGPGIPAEHRARIFEPFFTTKKDVGTGLGLWIVKSIIDKNNGSLRLRSRTTPGRSWTVFSIVFPAGGSDRIHAAPSAEASHNRL
jgi:two-component system, chemotaxis family, CheB/CheR fusion protein